MKKAFMKPNLIIVFLIAALTTYVTAVESVTQDIISVHPLQKDLPDDYFISSGWFQLKTDTKDRMVESLLIVDKPM